MTGVLRRESRKKFRRAHDIHSGAIEAMGKWMSELHDQPMFLVFDNLDVIHSNHAAREALGTMDWIQQSDRKFQILDSDLSRQLTDTLSRWPRPEVTRMRLVSGDRMIEVTALQLRRPISNVYVVELPKAVDKTVSCPALMSRFGLTKVEAGVAVLIYKGESRAAVAKIRNIALDTVKTHLKRIFMKMEVHSQRELIRKVNEWVSRG